jgi:hypothetical protein
VSESFQNEAPKARVNVKLDSKMGSIFGTAETFGLSNACGVLDSDAMMCDCLTVRIGRWPIRQLATSHEAPPR